MATTPERSEAAALHAELERRLQTIEDPAYEDPAHADVPGADLLWLGLFVVVVVIAAFVWGY
jgi:hypothetical protein